MKRVVISHRGPYYLLSLVIVILLLIGGCSTLITSPASVVDVPTPTPTPRTGRGVGGTLRLINREAPTILNPHLGIGVKDYIPGRITYEPLAVFDKDSTLIPVLAAEIPSHENGLLATDNTWVIWKLKQNVQWCDGENFTAGDVVFTYDYLTNPDVGAFNGTYYTTVDHLEALDDYTVKVFFQEPNPSWFGPFVGWSGVILPRHKFEDYNGKNAYDAPANMAPVGTGPYCVVSFKPQETLFLGTRLISTNKVVYEPNPYFRDPEKPYFSRVEYKGGGAADVAAIMVFDEGSADYAFDLQLTRSDWDRIATSQKGKPLVNFAPFVLQLDLNHTDPYQATADGERSSITIPHPFFSDKRVRQAFSLAIDQQAIVKLYGQGGRITSDILVLPEEYRSHSVTHEFDLKKASALLDEAGWIDQDGDGIREKDGKQMHVLFQTFISPLAQPMQDSIKRNLQSIGVDVELKLVDPIIFYGDQSSPDSFVRFEADMQAWENYSDSPNPMPYMAQWTCEQIPQKDNDWSAGYNTARWCNPDYDQLLEQSIKEIDPERRKQFFIRMNNMLTEDVVIIPIVWRATVSGASKDLEGVAPNPWDQDVWNIQDWRRASP